MSQLTSFQNNSINMKNMSVLSEPIIYKLQREVDHYTRKLEQEKRRLFGMDETFGMLNKELKEKKETVAKVQKETRTTEFKKILSTIKNLENNLDQTIIKFNETLAQNKLLQGEIDVLRRDRTNFLHIHQNVADQLRDKVKESEGMDKVISMRKNKTIDTQYQIHLLKKKNEEEKSNYNEKFDDLQKQIKDERRIKEMLNKTAAKPKDKIENFDTHTLLKRRLQKIILNNKEKVKVIDQYQKNMKIIDEAFNQIKEGSGITDIEEITNTFIKSQEQNFSLYAYVDILTQDIDNLEEENFKLKEEINSQKVKNEDMIRIINGTPDDEKQKKRINQIIEKKEVLLNDLQKNLSEIQESFSLVYNKLTISVFNENRSKNHPPEEFTIALNENNIDQYFAELESLMNNLILYKLQSTKGSKIAEALLLNELPIKEYIKNKVNQPIQLTHEDLGDNNKEMIDPNKFREVAVDIIEKKKQNALNISNAASNLQKKK